MKIKILWGRVFGILAVGALAGVFTYYLLNNYSL